MNWHHVAYFYLITACFIDHLKNRRRKSQRMTKRLFHKILEISFFFTSFKLKKKVDCRIKKYSIKVQKSDMTEFLEFYEIRDSYLILHQDFIE